jgi:hypothetical protein
MTHVHHCRDCENDWECVNSDCENYAAYLCLECFKALIWLQCSQASTGDERSALSEDKTNRSGRAAKGQ